MIPNGASEPVWWDSLRLLRLLVRFYSTPPIATDELLARILANATVSEPVRDRALKFARQWPEGK